MTRRKTTLLGSGPTWREAFLQNSTKKFNRSIATEQAHYRRTDEDIDAIAKTGEAFGGTTWSGRLALISDLETLRVASPPHT